jgi:ubiquinone biosynthesis protein
MRWQGRPLRGEDGGPPDRAQRNFTDPDSRILPTRDGFVQGYTLDPEFDIVTRAMPIARELARERISPAELKRGGHRLAAGLGRLAAASPDLVGLVEKVARTGVIPVEVSPARPSGARLSVQQDDVMAAGLLVAGAVLLDQQPQTGIMLWGLSAVSFAWRRLRRQ